jgi:hypothetical protein
MPWKRPYPYDSDPTVRLGQMIGDALFAILVVYFVWGCSGLCYSASFDSAFAPSFAGTGRRPFRFLNWQVGDEAMAGRASGPGNPCNLSPRENPGPSFVSA